LKRRYLNFLRCWIRRNSGTQGWPIARSDALLTEAQWQRIAPLLPKPPKEHKGVRPGIENRRVLEGILWILQSGARWQDMPEKFPHPSTCWWRLRD
jgi:transposase